MMKPVFLSSISIVASVAMIALAGCSEIVEKGGLITAPYDTGKDTDQDGLSDVYEIEVCYSKIDAHDSDGDGVSDFDECITHKDKGCDPMKANSDDNYPGDVFSDAEELQAAGACNSKDFDGDGAEDIDDCAKSDPNRYPGNQESSGLDGSDKNCSFEKLACTPVNPIADALPPECPEDFHIGINLPHAPDEAPNVLCFKATMIPGQAGADYFTDAHYAVRILRYKEVDEFPPVFAYERTNLPNHDCGPIVPSTATSSGIMNPAQYDDYDFTLDADQTFCSFQEGVPLQDNFVRIVRSGMDNLHLTFEVQLNPLYLLYHSTSGFYWSMGNAHSVRCQFGD